MPPGYPTAEALREHGSLPLLKARLPFNSILVGSENDALCNMQRAEWNIHMDSLVRATKRSAVTCKAAVQNSGSKHRFWPGTVHCQPNFRALS